MNKVILHIGHYPTIERGDVGDLEVAGTIYLSPAEMSEVGRDLRPNAGEWELLGDRNVFTNSDHVLNGMRLALKAGDLLVQQVQVLFYEFETAPVEIEFKQNGRSSNWPAGFMDQIENDLSQL